MKMNPAEVDRRLDQSMHAWESACPGQPFAEMTLEQFKQTRQLCLDAKAKLAAAEAQWQAARKERNTLYESAVEQLQLVVNSVKGHPKYGENSAVYTAMGYVPKSERASGLSRRRARPAPKEPGATS
jgi:hypothetical protein